MLRVRDELKMTLMAYQVMIMLLILVRPLSLQCKSQVLYESSIAFGIRKALKAEAGKAEMETYIQKLELEKAKLDKEVSCIVCGELHVAAFMMFVSGERPAGAVPDGGEEGNRAAAGRGEGARGGNRPPEEDQPAAQVPAGGDPA